MNEITVSGTTYDEALENGLTQLGIGRELVDVEVLADAHDDVLPGAAPLEGVTLRLKVRMQDIVDRARHHLQKILELVGVKARVEVLDRSRGITLNIIAGDDGSLIIGKGGQNLEALQYLINRMATRGTKDISPIMVDSEGYKDRHISKLEEIARRAAARVRRSGREVALKPMSPADRRIIHMTLKGMRGVHTISRGEEMERHVVVTTDKMDRGNGVLKPGRPPRREDGDRGGERGGSGERRDRDRDRGRGGRERGRGGRGRGGRDGGGRFGAPRGDRPPNDRPKDDNFGNVAPPEEHDDVFERPVDDEADNFGNR